jgi:very-short-patch-repair endonuclease
MIEFKQNKRIHNCNTDFYSGVGPFIVDFFCNAAELVIEADGDVHDVPEVKEYDEEREAYLKNLGLKILRFRNEEVLVNLSTVLDKIEKYLLAKRTSPRPSPGGRGSSSG